MDILRNKLSLKNLKRYIKITYFYLRNISNYKRLGFGALVIKPLRVDGMKYISLMKNSIVKNYTWLIALKIDEYDPELIIGEGSSIGEFNHISASRKVVFGKNVLTAHRVYISDNTHGYEDISIPIMHQPVKYKGEVYIGDGSWIGENACIIGVKIGRQCVIGSNSLVLQDIPDYSVAVGSPARIIKRYNTSSMRWDKVDQEYSHSTKRS